MDGGASAPKILYVDDDPGAIALKKQVLERAGYEVTSCLTVEDAVAELQREKFDAVITDWRMGQSRGRSVVEAVKRQSRSPVLVVSGYVAEAFHAAEPMADIYLEKPVDPRELVEILGTLLGRGLGTGPGAREASKNAPRDSS
jgi:DNA-binding response OmpR family regulator